MADEKKKIFQAYKGEDATLSPTPLSCCPRWRIDPLSLPSKTDRIEYASPDQSDASPVSHESRMLSHPDEIAT